ncbi:hypothetical protein GEMRC1_006837 [Eukaryota sp. GEM-RC1]
MERPTQSYAEISHQIFLYFRRVAPSPSPSFKKKNRSEKKDPTEKDPNKCSFCDFFDHKIIHCNHPDCRRSELPADQRLPRSEAKKPPSRSNSSRKHNKYSKYNVQHINHIHNNTSSSNSHNPYANPLHNISNSSGTNSLSLNSIFSIIDHQDPPPFLSCSLTINGVSIQGLWDSGASMSVITQDLVDRCSMTFINKKVHFTSANNVRSHSLGSAHGILTFKFSKVSHLTSVTKTLPSIPGSNKYLLGIDLMKQLGLLTEEGLIIPVQQTMLAHSNDESEFDSNISMPNSSSIIDNTDFNKFVYDSGCSIKLDDDDRTNRLLNLLSEFSTIFDSVPHKDGIDCSPMTIDFHDEESTVKRKPRRLNPVKQRIAEETFHELVRLGYAEYTNPNGKFSSPVVLVVYPDHRKPRLTGDFSGTGGINELTKTVEPNLPRIADIQEFLSETNYIATLNLPKAFWQLNLRITNVTRQL